MFNLLKQIILLFEPEYKSIQIGPNLEVFQKIWKSSGKSGSLPENAGSLPEDLEVFQKIWKIVRKTSGSFRIYCKVSI